ncbi:MAG: lysine--tRNA ligase [Patescibacteria group bacterium]
MEKDLLKLRRQKLEALISRGVNPFPSKVNKTMTASAAKNAKVATVAGRLRLIRGHGKAAFADLCDETGKIQLYFKYDNIGKEKFEIFELLEMGDFISATGEIFTTKTGEQTIRVEDFDVLVKALRTLPDKWHGLKDVEDRYRMRYLDLMFNPEVKKSFEIRSKAIQALRDFLLKKDFIEVETPVLQTIAGGASAKPFVTHYNAYDCDVYLRIAPELYLKRLLVGGYERVFEFARCFRNEGVDWSHNPEFTMLEFYHAYIDYNQLMTFTEEMIISTVKNATGNDYIEHGDEKIIIKSPFKRITFAEVTGGKNTDEAFKEGVKKIKEPTFVIDHPSEMLPLAKPKEGGLAQSFQLIIAGTELVKAFSELNDPDVQRANFENQLKLRKEGDEEAQMGDEDFVEALEYGMPPTAGWGMGIDRFVMLLTDTHTLREVIYFPFMKPVNKLKVHKVKSL